MDVVSFSSSAKTLSAKYIDDQNIDIKSSKSKLEQGITIHSAEIFNGAKDSKIGGYSALYLTNQKYGEDILKFKDIITNSENIVVTDLIHSGVNDYALYINVPKVIDADTRTTCSFVLVDQVQDINNTYFELEIINERYCRLYHKINNDVLYLTVNDTFDIYFDNLKGEIPSGLEHIDEYVFAYILDKDQDKMSLYKPVSGYNYNLTIDTDKQLTLTKITSGSFVPFNSSNTFNIRYSDRIATISPKFNTSWVSYSDINDLTINTAKSAFKNKSNYLLSTQYSLATGEDIEVNILPLKNQLTKEGVSQRGNYLLDIPNKLYPQTSLRDYKRLHIGSNRENGIDEIALTYNFYNTEFIFKPDEYTVFKTPDSLYPYVKLNINDTLFSQNGALGGDSPHSSDKLYTKNVNGSYPNIGTYLCTWLSGGNSTTPGLWVDRYFNISKVSPVEALTATSVKLFDFRSAIEENIDNSVILNELFFDVKSDLTIEPSTEYIYQRIGENYIKSFTDHLSDSTVFDNLTARSFRGSIDVPTETTETYDFTNKYHYSFIDESVSSFTFSFWLETDWDKPFGYQLAGNFNNKGFGIFNDENVTPFIMIPHLGSIYVYNTDFQQINKIDFPGIIQHIVRANPLDDFYVIVKQKPEREAFSEDADDINVLYKLKSNGTVVDADNLIEIPDYINIYNTETDIYFLLDTTGTVSRYDILKETLTDKTVSIPAERGITFDIKSIAQDKFGNLIGFRGEKSIRIDDDNHIFLIRNGLLVSESDDHTTRSILLSTTSTIHDFAVDDDENFYVLHNRYLSKFTKQRDIIYKIALDSENTNIAVDIVREYTDTGLKSYPIVMSTRGGSSILTKIDESTGNYNEEVIRDVIVSFYSSCDLDSILNYYNLTNFSAYIKNKQFNNELKFRIEVPNRYNNRDSLSKSITVDISKLSVGKHHFVYRLDTISGNISLFVDGIRVDNITFDPAEYALDSTLYNTFNVGTATFFNGSVLSNYIKQNGYYFCRNIIIEQPRLYKKGISDIDIKFLNMQNIGIGELVASLPCGQRNQVEQIQRLFKWQTPGNKSNKVNIRVRSDVLTNTTANTVLKEIIRRDIRKNLPASVDVNEIIFETY